ncbi:MAG: OmpA family protein [Spirochaetes bacterium]|nr:OmpA family protein [Spirochaetota bacterium]
MAENYYRVIRGKKYDRRMLELAEGLTSGKGDGRISMNDAKTLLRVVKDSNSYSPIEKQTMEYIRKHFKFTKEGDELFRTEIRKWAASKRGSKQSATPRKKAASIVTTSTASDSEAESVAAAARSPEVAYVANQKRKSPWLQILLALFFIAAAAALYYFIFYKSGCATTPSVVTKPATLENATAKTEFKPPAQVPGKSTISIEAREKIEKTTLRFIAEKTAVTPAMAKQLDSLADLLKGTGSRLQVSGHTCSLGTRTINERVSDARAQVVKTALVERGVNASDIETRAVADSEPVGDNNTVAGRVANRRVAFKILN